MNMGTHTHTHLLTYIHQYGYDGEGGKGQQYLLHKNAELVPDSVRTRMHVRSTRQVRVDSEFLVMYQLDKGFFGGVQGRCTR